MEEVEQLKKAFKNNMIVKIKDISDPIQKQQTRTVSDFIIRALSGSFSVKKTK